MLTGPVTGRPRHLMRDEAGVIAIVVALSVSTFLLGFAALAVDMGTAYVRKAELESIADKIALAGANGLPTITDGLASALGTLGSSAGGGTGLCRDQNLPGVCDAPAGWADDGSTDNGEITFYADEGQAGDLSDNNGDGVLNTLDKVTSGTQAVGIDVLLPPSRVTFGFASALGFDSTTLQQHATARIGTPLGSGILPFALTPTDLIGGQFCVTDPTAVGQPVPVPAPRGFVLLFTGNPLVDPGDTLTFTLVGNFRAGRVTVHFATDTDPAGVPATQIGGIYQVTVPAGDPGSVVRVWATGRLTFGGTYVSTSDTIRFRGSATVPLCDRPQSLRGFVKLARTAAGDTLEPNVRSGPEVKLYPSTGLLGTLGTTLGCLGDTLGPPPSTACLSTVLSEPFSQRMTDGFFKPAGGKDGRLVGDCTGDTDSPHGFGGVDASRLLDTASPLLDASFGTLNQLKTSIANPAAPVGKEGWVRSRALKCPRMAVMPIVDPVPTALGAQNITGFTYVWIDDDGALSGDRGLTWAGNRLRSFQGFIINPKLLPELVSGSPVVGPYLGDSMPKESMLIPDLPTP